MAEHEREVPRWGRGSHSSHTCCHTRREALGKGAPASHGSSGTMAPATGLSPGAQPGPSGPCP